MGGGMGGWLALRGGSGGGGGLHEMAVWKHNDGMTERVSGSARPESLALAFGICLCFGTSIFGSFADRGASHSFEQCCGVTAVNAIYGSSLR